jgi:hypothetical protein
MKMTVVSWKCKIGIKSSEKLEVFYDNCLNCHHIECDSEVCMCLQQDSWVSRMKGVL